MEAAMCLAIPAEIVELTGNLAKIELMGNVREADVSLIEEPTIGDWVLLHAGFAIEKLSAEDAKETLELFSKMEGLPDGSAGD
jgi:hydrogenase expression/formation protein HypC